MKENIINILCIMEMVAHANTDFRDSGSSGTMKTGYSLGTVYFICEGSLNLPRSRQAQNSEEEKFASILKYYSVYSMFFEIGSSLRLLGHLGCGKYTN